MKTLSQQLEGIAELKNTMYHVGKSKSRSHGEKREIRPETAGGSDAVEISPSPRLHSYLVSGSVL